MHILNLRQMHVVVIEIIHNGILSLIRDSRNSEQRLTSSDRISQSPSESQDIETTTDLICSISLYTMYFYLIYWESNSKPSNLVPWPKPKKDIFGHDDELEIGALRLSSSIIEEVFPGFSLMTVSGFCREVSNAESS